MKGALVCCFVALSSALCAQGTKVFSHYPSNFKFTHPESWKIKKVKDDYKITIPIANSAEIVTLDIFAMSFTSAPEVWESSQKYFAEQLKQTVLSSTREEILGVELLLYKLQETATPARKITLAGIFYAATDYKLLFRLTAPEAVYSEAEYQWRQALNTFATIDGQQPEPEKPGRATEASAGKTKPPKPEERPVSALGNTAQASAEVLAENSSALTIAARECHFRYSKEWTLTKNGESAGLSHPQVPGTVRFQFFSVRDSAPMSIALGRESLSKLADLDIVTKREENLPTLTLAKTKLIRVYREGKTKNSVVSWLQAGSEKGELYWLAEYKSEGPLDQKVRKLIEDLFSASSLESLAPLP